jgi:NAD(P)-dependent dehydrogenase (short-subunit alcohol dehydrogenase family)
MSKKLKDKIAVITGGTEGIGLATAKLFVEEGAYVFITGRRQKELDEAAKAIGSNVTGVQGDVANLADLDRLYKTVAKMKGTTRYCFRQRRRWRICSLRRRHRRAFRQAVQHECKGNAVYRAKGIAAPEGWWLHHSQRLRREC